MEKNSPIVPFGLILAERIRKPYDPLVLLQYEILYATAQTLRLRTSGVVITQRQSKVYCLPTAESWAEVQRLNAELGSALATLADGLRALGRYDLLFKAGESAKNPLSSIVIDAICPDTAELPNGEEYGYCPSLQRLEAISHSSVMLKVRRDDGPAWQSRQKHFFVCPLEQDWERISALYEAAKSAATALQNYLLGLDTYDRAVKSGRYSSQSSPFRVGDRVEVSYIDKFQPGIALGCNGMVVAVEPFGVEVVIEGINPILFQPGQLRAYVEPPPPLPEFNEGDLVRGYRANSKRVRGKRIQIQGRVETQNDAVVFTSTPEGEMVGLEYEGLELLEAAPPSESAPGDAFNQLMQALGESEPAVAEVYQLSADLQTLAQQANDYHRQCEQAWGTMLDAARQSGQALLEARSKIRAEGGRNWLQWLQLNFSGSQRTAYNYLNIAEHWEEKIAPKLHQVATLGLRGALALLEEEREPVAEPERRQFELFPDQAFNQPPAADPDPDSGYRPPSEAPFEIAAVVTGYDSSTGEATLSFVELDVSERPTQAEVDEANWEHLPVEAEPVKKTEASCRSCRQRRLEADGSLYSCKAGEFADLGSVLVKRDWAAENGGCVSYQSSRQLAQPQSSAERVVLEPDLSADDRAVVESVCEQFGVLSVLAVALNCCQESELETAYDWASRKRYNLPWSKP